MTSASPVSESSEPSVSPAPKSSTVPQSMRVASFQVSVKRRSPQFSGSMNSSAAARMATTPSSTWVESHSYRPESGATVWTAPGTTQNVTAARKTSSVLRSPRDMRPILRRSSPSQSWMPGISLVSGRFMTISSTHMITNITSTIGAASTTHSKNPISSPVPSWMNSRPTRFAGLPIGVSRPPTVLP